MCEMFFSELTNNSHVLFMVLWEISLLKLTFIDGTLTFEWYLCSEFKKINTNFEVRIFLKI
jgi:hypothetical protein